MRIAIEEFVLRELTGKLSEEQLAILEDIIEKQDQCIESEETTRFLSLGFCRAFKDPCTNSTEILDK
jgi:DNA-binding GntR family transcriptional regulator